MSTYVLVHGAFHGGWCWRNVANQLRTRGHEVYTPTLTGLGERAHLAHAGVNLTTHIEDVLALFRCERLNNVVLAGHSYGGMVITGVADRLAEDCRALVYVDAMLPTDGESQLDLMSTEKRMNFVGLAAQGGGWAIPPLPASYFNVERASDAAWIDGLCTPQPLATFVERIALKGAYAALVPRRPRIYLQAARFAGSTFKPRADLLRTDPAWTFVDFDCGHEVMIDQPDALSALLADLA